MLDRSPALLAASEDLQRITAAYKASCVAEEKGTQLFLHAFKLYMCSNYDYTGEKDKFLAEYLLAIELQAKSPPPAQKLPIPDDGIHLLSCGAVIVHQSGLICRLPLATVLTEVFMYLSDREVLHNVGSVNKWMYRLSRDNAFWSQRMHLVFPDVAYVTVSNVPFLCSLIHLCVVCV